MVRQRHQGRCQDHRPVQQPTDQGAQATGGPAHCGRVGSPGPGGAGVHTSGRQGLVRVCTDFCDIDEGCIVDAHSWARGIRTWARRWEQRLRRLRRRHLGRTSRMSCSGLSVSLQQLLMHSAGAQHDMMDGGAQRLLSFGQTVLPQPEHQTSC